MTQANIRTTVTLKQAADLILACPGNRFLLQGEPGIGKSSIIKLITRFYEFQEGRILVDDRDLRSYDLSTYRRHLGLGTFGNLGAGGGFVHLGDDELDLLARRGRSSLGSASGGLGREIQADFAGIGLGLPRGMVMDLKHDIRPGR